MKTKLIKTLLVLLVILAASVVQQIVSGMFIGLSKYGLTNNVLLGWYIAIMAQLLLLMCTIGSIYYIINYRQINKPITGAD